MINWSDFADAHKPLCFLAFILLFIFLSVFLLTVYRTCLTHTACVLLRCQAVLPSMRFLLSYINTCIAKCFSHVQMCPCDCTHVAVWTTARKKERRREGAIKQDSWLRLSADKSQNEFLMQSPLGYRMFVCVECVLFVPSLIAFLSVAPDFFFFFFSVFQLSFTLDYKCCDTISDRLRAVVSSKTNKSLIFSKELKRPFQPFSTFKPSLLCLFTF